MREPEYTQNDRDELEALYLLAGRDCPCGCGQPRRLTEDPNTEWEYFEHHCSYSRQIAMLNRHHDKKHEDDSLVKDGAFYALPTDGLSIGLNPPSGEG